LKAEVVVEHDSFGMTWKMGVTIQSVGHRLALEAPLALDFGNTNSYGSAELRGLHSSDPIAVRSLLERSADPETFASALAFRDLDDEEHPEYEIGREALKLGKDRPQFLERGLKRELSALRPVVDASGNLLPLDHPEHPFNNRRYTYPREGAEPARFSLRDLVRLYLLAAIARCEEGERRTVTELGLSYPANLGPEPRRALNLVIRDLEAECKARNPELASEIAFRPLGPDEASAVALGFVLNPETIDQRISPLFRDGRASFMLASFDFGGGSVDIALIRFDLEGDPPLTSFSSTLLGLGGDEYFGGDNVTVAAYEILESRIAQVLGSTRKLPLAPLDVLRHRSDPRGWANRQALWNAAEAAKRAACRGEPPAARGEIATALEGLHPDDRSVLDVIRSEIVGGRLDLALTDIYEHRVARDLSGKGNYTVGGRLEKSVAMLREFANRAGPDSSPKFLVLAGAACRVPLARELLRAEFPEAVIVPEGEVIPDGYRPKSKVADGLARFLEASRGGTSDHFLLLKAAQLFTHADLLWINPIQRAYQVVWVPSCVELERRDWHPLKIKKDGVPPRDVPLKHAWSGTNKVIKVHRRALPEPELVGTARLDRPADLIEDGVTPQLPEPSAELDEAEILLRIDGEEDYLRLRVRIKGAEFGDWRVRPVLIP
jgi:molecular chaperone DnaK (HSP70)